MFFSEEYISDAEKINRIYTMLRNERRGRMFKLIIKLLLIGGIAYGYYFLSLPANAEIRTKISDMVQIKMTEFIMPMVGNMVQDLTKNMQIPGQTNTPTSLESTPTRKKNTPTTTAPAPPITITPELIKAAQDMLNKQQ